MSENSINHLDVAIRIVTIKNGKVLLVSNDRDGFHYLIGGKMEFGEPITECVQRELKEETGMDINVEFKKFLYIKELIKEDKHKLELFVLVEIDKFEELEGLHDPEHHETDHLTWVDINDLPNNLKPPFLLKKLKADYDSNFEAYNIYHDKNLD